MSSQLLINDKIEVEKLIKVTRFKKEVRKTSPHKHKNYFEIIYLSAGSGYHYIDVHKYIITPPQMFFVRQEQVHYWDITTEPDGYVLIIRKSFIEHSLDSELKSLITKISGECCLQLSNTDTIEKLLGLLADENEANDKNSFLITDGLLKSLLAKVLQVSERVLYNKGNQSDLFQSFIQQLSSSNGIKSKVAYYAGKLNTTPQNINAACQNSIQKTAKDLLGEFVLIEAKRLLLYTNKTVSEISFCLEFNDPSHFVKYFKKVVGSTPNSFRKDSR